MATLELKPMHKAVAAAVGCVSPLRAAFQWWPSARTGLWEAKDSADDRDKESKHKFSIGYPKQKILFWRPDCAVLYHKPTRRELFKT